MTANRHADLLAMFQRLGLAPARTVSHRAAPDSAAWRAELEGTARGKEGPPYLATKTLVFKPKAAKTAAVTPVVLVALESTETNASALARKLGLKEMRLAAEDLLKDFFGADKTCGR
ncbi:MAG: hypothetical protein BJ554DRAFT_2011 [Olpidium bornovanus]|uniref:YbaK/aminoacyl-tRNA synthetase-associated domain-containing protein n=1 Tax=Olpidium bornovanus TaxID=278681 RepID=A0A8H7ZRD9_9FUNG|nr:MAG: hypothetical protein BJ554DRAFT_2011 [Olpidium bornovanus]